MYGLREMFPFLNSVGAVPNYMRCFPFSVGLALSRRTRNTVSVPRPLYTTVYNTSGMAESDLGWPTPLVMYVL